MNIHSWTILASLMALAIGTPAMAGELHHRKGGIAVNGEGSVSAVPDSASVSTGVVTEAADPKQALAQNNAAVSALLDVLKNDGIADKDIQTSQFRIDPQYRRSQDQQAPLQITGYQVTNQLQIRVREIARLGGLLDALVRAGGNQMSGITFEHSRLEELVDEARRRAVADARRRAELYAAAAGVTVGDVISISETDVAVPRPMYRAEVAMMAADAAVPVAAGESEIRAMVHVRFAIATD